MERNWRWLRLRRDRLEPARIVALCVAASVSYGIVHDQITARICVEYFTIAHPRLVGTEDPTTLGLLWGVLATWWVGLGLRVLLAAAARYGQRPARTARSLTRVVAMLLVATAALSGIAGATAWALAGSGWLVLFEPWATRIAPERQQAFLAVAAAHSMSYLAGGLGGAVQIWRVWRSRQAPVDGSA
jgi:hypothetical protein